MKKIVKGIRIFEKTVDLATFGESPLSPQEIDKEYYEVDGVPSKIRSLPIYLSKEINDRDRYLLAEDGEKYKKYLARSFSHKIGEIIYETLDIKSKFDNIKDNRILVNFVIEDLNKLEEMDNQS